MATANISGHEIDGQNFWFDFGQKSEDRMVWSGQKMTSFYHRVFGHKIGVKSTKMIKNWMKSVYIW